MATEPRGLAERLELPYAIRNAQHELALTVMYAARRLSACATAVLRDHGLTESAFNVLMLLAYQSDGDLTHGELSRRMLVRPANITGVIDRMERDGLVKRRPDADDRRIRRVEMTAAGRKRLQRAEPAYLGTARAIAGDLQADDAAALREQLLRFCDAIDAAEAT